MILAEKEFTSKKDRVIVGFEKADDKLYFRLTAPPITTTRLVETSLLRIPIDIKDVEELEKTLEKVRCEISEGLF